jgi:hypothetical protein
MADSGITRIDISVQIACARILTAKDGSKFRVDQADLAFVPDGDRWAVTYAFLSGPDVEPDGALSMIRRNGLRLTPPDSSGTIPERINAVLGVCMPGGNGRISTDSDFYACPKPDCDTPRDEAGDCPVHEIPLLHIGPDGHVVA